ncbi:MAG: DrmB family protein [Phycisphaerales bacterium]
MPHNQLNALRRSQAIMPFGPGAVLDVRAQGGGLASVVIAGLEAWDASAPPAGLDNGQVTHEPRLERTLRVGGFRLPPVVPESMQNRKETPHLLGVRFPDYLQCTKCHLIGPAKKWAREPGSAAKYCDRCSTGPKARRYVVPVRFVTACENGHIEDFPWDMWVGHRPDCSHGRYNFLKLEGTARSGLAGLVLRCPKCEAFRSMEGALSKEAMKGIGASCRGKRPWLPQGNDETGCTAPYRAMLRGASNMYFGVTASALDIPPWSDPLQKRLARWWGEIVALDTPEERADLIRLLKLPSKLAMDPDTLLREVESRLASLSNTAASGVAALRLEEYRQLTNERAVPLDESTEFETRGVVVPLDLRVWFSKIVSVLRLREVRALTGFTRIRPWAEEGIAGQQISRLSVRPKNWLPAIEVRGEGVFLELNRETLAAWEPAFADRAASVHADYQRDWSERTGGGTPPKTVTPRLLLIHSLAHALMRQLSIECGYATASLRERLYVGTGAQDMAGLLIYTATTDSEGTLGGLSRQADPDRFAPIVYRGVRAMEWCSTDPLCITLVRSLSDPLNRAACHACMLAPETACEEMNRLLDRATLIGTRGPGKSSRLSGFFEGMFAGGSSSPAEGAPTCR